MRVYFRRFGTVMSQQLLNIPQISTLLKQMRCKGVPQRMCRHMLRDIGLLPSPLHDLLNRSFGYMTTRLRAFKKPLNYLILFDICLYHLTCQIRVQGIAVLASLARAPELAPARRQYPPSATAPRLSTRNLAAYIHPTSPLPHPPAAKSHTDSPDSPTAMTPASPTAATRAPP